MEPESDEEILLGEIEILDWLLGYVSQPV